MDTSISMKVTWRELEVPGLLLGSGASLEDDRGSFTKVLSGVETATDGFKAEELYWARSARGVLRGLHLQMPPAAARKLVYVVQGEIRDFVLDLRVGSPMERTLFEIRLTPETGVLLIPAGCAHAYETLAEDTIVCYGQDVAFRDEQTYAGIRPDSAGIIPITSNPTIAARDLAFPSLADFSSPFLFEPI